MAAPTILLAEPNPSTRTRVCAALEGQGYFVRSVQSAESALSERERFTPDVIIQALFLPDMDGFELARKLRSFEAGAAIPMVALLGLEAAVDADRARVVSAGFVAVLTSPVQPAEVIAAVEAHIPVPAPRRTDVGKRRRILLADDNPVQLRLLQFQLEAAGFRVAVAPGGAEALALARQDPPDAIVSDVLMPHLDGFQLCLEVRQDPALARIPILLLSFQYFEPSDVELAAKAGATRFMTRPIHASDLVEAVLAVLSDEVPFVAAPMQPAGEVDHAHHDRVKRQLERQLALSAALAQSCTIQSTQLSLLGGMADALSRGADVENVVRELLPGCLDAAGMSKGALFVLDPKSGHLAVHCAVGFAEDQAESLAGFFGCLSVLGDVVQSGTELRVPSRAVAAEMAARLLSRAALVGAYAVPLASEGKRIGVLFGGREMSVDTGVDPIPFMRALAGHIGQALALSRTFWALKEAISTRDDFLVVASHELRTPLTSLGLQVTRMQRLANEDATAEATSARMTAQLDMVYRQLRQLDQIVSTLLDVRHIHAGAARLQCEAVDLEQIVRVAIRRVEEQFGDAPPRISLTAPGPVIGVWDPFWIQSIVNNLLSNAVKFSGRGPIDVLVEDDGHWSRLVVKDHGIGIAPDDQRRVFEKFERAAPTSNYGGLGVGLWIVRSQVEAHGGTVNVSSRPGAGATFSVELPLVPPGAAPHPSV